MRDEGLTKLYYYSGTIYNARVSMSIINLGTRVLFTKYYDMYTMFCTGFRVKRYYHEVSWKNLFFRNPVFIFSVFKYGLHIIIGA